MTEEDSHSQQPVDARFPFDIDLSGQRVTFGHRITADKLRTSGDPRWWAIVAVCQTVLIIPMLFIILLRCT